MFRVLQVFGEPLDNGGQEAFIMNMYRNIDREKIQFDFFTPYYCANEKLRNEIESLGGRVFEKNGKFDSQGNKKDYIENLKKFFSENKYDIVHIHSGSIFALAYGAKIAKKNGVKTVIVHSHATGNDNLKYRIIKMISSRVFLKYADKYFACSAIAAKWKFPKKVIKKNKFVVLKNGIDLEKFRFDEAIREEYRKDFNIEKDDLVIGNVGRLEYQKNHHFLIQIFEEIIKRRKNSKLLLVGAGNLKEEIINSIKEKNIEDKVILLEKRNDVHKIMQAMDVFVFPSIFEGLGIVAIEAQAASLPTICSEAIPSEANVTELFKRLELKCGKEKWADEILNTIHNREDYIDKLKEQGYEAKDVAKYLQSIYLEELK